jgi:hypothetical protein
MWGFKQVSHQPCGSRTPICDQPLGENRWIWYGSLKTSVQIRKVSRLSQRRKLDFRHAHFLCEFRAIPVKF